MDSIWIFGTTIGAGAVIAANLYAGLSMRFWTVIVWVVQAISIFSYFVWALIYSAFDGWYKNTAYYAMATITFWAQILLTQLCTAGALSLSEKLQLKIEVRAAPRHDALPQHGP